MSGDVLSAVLASMRVSGTVYFCDQLDAPWSKEFRDTAVASFHQIRRGSCWVQVDDETEYLGPGDLVFLEPGLDHVLTSQLAGQKPQEKTLRTLLLCGYCDFTHGADTPLRSVFPKMAIVRQEEIQERPWLKGTLDQLAAEYLSMQPGAQLVVNKLTEVLLVELIRINFGRIEQNAFLRALNDKHVARALQQLHNHPETGWTLENLAREIGMSRAALARRFKTLVGQPMFEYLTRLRMQRARELLQETSLPLHEVASRVGYESDIAFTKTFKKRTGMTPTRYRKQAG